MEAESLNTSSTFNVRALYGGAIQTVIPEDFLDASEFRQVPDTQEVFVSAASGANGVDDSLIFDLLEMARDDAPTLEKLDLELHISDLAEANAVPNQWTLGLVESVAVDVNGEGKDNEIEKALVGTCIMPAHKWGRSERKDIEGDSVDVDRLSPTPLLLVVLGVLRLKEFTTDVVVSFNVPLIFRDDIEMFKNGDGIPRVEAANIAVKKSLEAFRLLNKGLFGA
ncbi:Mog1p/PsbP-like protein [Nadsonia fulvescens var. elongata DSM 6958]|uniref:Mog1p/PsbP-like protein n=1 Tax=Nadsonia fulvescens var. elongata DSM 6958 TaxID=857566 RepID=A0A1E3PN78_9ASCO|nr:Mog1p/PsbP-like protein [Nadsonia fulvescens var. elongata DSM 6958]